jgi:hypothetical protein
MYHASKANRDCIRELILDHRVIQHINAIITSRESYGLPPRSTALHFVCKTQTGWALYVADIITILIDNGADPCLKNDDGKTALDYLRVDRYNRDTEYGKAEKERRDLDIVPAIAFLERVMKEKEEAKERGERAVGPKREGEEEEEEEERDRKRVKVEVGEEGQGVKEEGMDVKVEEDVQVKVEGEGENMGVKEEEERKGDGVKVEVKTE